MRRLLLIGLMFLAVIAVFGTGCQQDPELALCVGWVVGGSVDGYGLILKTEDGGTTWQRQGNSATVPDVFLEAVSAADDQNVWAVGGVSDADGSSYGTILHTTDGGETWTRQGDSATTPDVEFNGVVALDARNAWVVGTKGYILKTSDAGATWIEQQQDTFAGYLEGVYAYGENLFWAGGEAGSASAPPVIVHTSDGGNTWVRQGEGMLPDSTGIIDMHGAGPNTVWAVGTDQVCYLTTDGGENWVAKREHMPFSAHYNGVCAVDEQTAWVAVDYSVALFTPNAGDSWDMQSTPGVGRQPYNLKVTATHADTAWMTATSAGPGAIVHTDDGGINWVMQLRTDSAGLGDYTGLRGISIAGAAR